MRSSTIWVAGGPRFNSSTGSRYMSGNTYHQARPGWQTNGLLLGIIPISAVLASFAAPSTSRRRQRTIAGTIAFLLLAGTFLTKGDGYGGTGFWLALIAVGGAIYAFRVAKQHDQRPPAIPENS